MRYVALHENSIVVLWHLYRSIQLVDPKLAVKHSTLILLSVLNGDMYDNARMLSKSGSSFFYPAPFPPHPHEMNFSGLLDFGQPSTIRNNGM